MLRRHNCRWPCQHRLLVETCRVEGISGAEAWSETEDARRTIATVECVDKPTKDEKGRSIAEKGERLVKQGKPWSAAVAEASRKGDQEKPTRDEALRTLKPYFGGYRGRSNPSFVL